MGTCEVQLALSGDLEKVTVCGKPATRLFIFKFKAELAVGTSSVLRRRFYVCDECVPKLCADYAEQVGG